MPAILAWAVRVVAVEGAPTLIFTHPNSHLLLRLLSALVVLVALEPRQPEGPEIQAGRAALVRIVPPMAVAPVLVAPEAGHAVALAVAAAE